MKIQYGSSPNRVNTSVPATTQEMPHNAPARVLPTTDRRRQERILVIWFLVAGLVATMTTTAFGQVQYQVLPINPALEEPATFKKMETAAKAVSQARDLADVGAANGRMAAFYYSKYIPAKITQPDSVTEISKLIDTLRDRLSSAERSRAPGAGPMRRWIYDGLKPIAQGNYQPAARINAILFISKMDTAPANRQTQSPPVPLSVIPADLIPIYQDKTASDGVRAAALQGLHRYVVYAAPSLRDPLRSTLVTEMQQLLDSEAPEGRSKDAHAYLKRFAVDILASLRGATDADLSKKLISISTETKQHDLIALHSAARLGAMAEDMKGNVGSSAKVLDSWAIRAMRSFQYEIARLNAFERPTPATRQPAAADAMASAKKDETKKPSAASRMGSGMESDMDYGADYGSGSDQYEGDMGMEGMDGMDGTDDMYGGGYGGSMYGVVQANPQPPEVLVSRRKLNHVLEQLHKGVSGSGAVGVPRTPGGLLAAVEDDQKQVVTEWITKMEGVITALNEPTLDTLEKYVEALDLQVAMLEEIAGPEAVAAAAQEPILLPGVSRIVATKPVEKAEVPDAPVLDKAGAPTFPANLDELAPPE
ncbi:MAG: hypothetical protein WBD20_04860 [Pirellulaceae bacterium]